MPATLKSRFPEIAASMRLQLSRDCKTTAEDIATDAKANVNVGPVAPHIADIIEVNGGAGHFTVDVPDPGEGYPYPRAIEYGRKSAPPYPFLVPAAEANREAFEGRVQNTLASL